MVWEVLGGSESEAGLYCVVVILFDRRWSLGLVKTRGQPWEVCHQVLSLCRQVHVKSSRLTPVQGHLLGLVLKIELGRRHWDIRLEATLSTSAVEVAHHAARLHDVGIGGKNSGLPRSRAGEAPTCGHVHRYFNRNKVGFLKDPRLKRSK